MKTRFSESAWNPKKPKTVGVTKPGSRVKLTFYFYLFIYFFRERGGREGEREGEKH